MEALKSAARTAAFSARKISHQHGLDARACDHLGAFLAASSPFRVVSAYMPIRTEISPLPVMAALVAFVKRQAGVDHVRFLRYGDDAAKAIEALKGWMEREADVDWGRRNSDSPYRQTSGFRIAWAQWRKLARGDGLIFRREVMLLTGKPVDYLVKEADWVPVMNAFGERIREAQR